MHAFPSIKLTYFDMAAKAEPIRLALFIAGVPFEDKRVSHEEFAKIKDSTPYGQLPVMDVDGMRIAQAQAQLMLAGRLGGSVPANSPLAEARINEIICAIDDLFACHYPSLVEKDEEKKKELRVDLANNTIPATLELIEARLALMSQMSVFQTETILPHELAVYNLVRTYRAGFMDNIPTTIVDNYKELNRITDKVLSHPKVIEWNARKHSATPKIKVSYFDFRGRAEDLRLALTIGGIPFEDHRMTLEEFKSIKESYPFKQLPVLQVDDEEICQSAGILQYVGTLAGLYPTTKPLIACRVDEIIQLVNEHFVHKYKYGKPQEEVVTHKMKQLDDRIGHWASEYAVADEMTIADVAIYGYYQHITKDVDDLPKDTAAGYKNMDRVIAKVEALPQVAEWNKTH